MNKNLDDSSNIPLDQRTPFPQTKKLVKPDGTIMFVWNGKMHNTEGPAFIPQGDKKKREYYLYGIKYTQEKFEQVKKDSTGLPFFKQSGINKR